MIQKRYLDAIEQRMLNYAPAIAVKYDGRLSTDAFLAALRVTSTTYPVLSARIVPCRHGYQLEASDDVEPEVISKCGDEDSLLRAVQGPWDPTQRVSQLINVFDGHSGYVALRVDHSVFDGTSLTRIFREIWNAYAKLDHGIFPQPATGTLPAAPMELLKSEFPSVSTSDAFNSDLLRSRNDRVAPIQGRIRISRAATSKLIRLGQESSNSVHSLICASILGAHRSAINTRTAVPVQMSCHSLVNLRNRIASASSVSVASFIGLHETKAFLEEGTNYLTLGRLIKSEISDAIRTRRVSPAIAWQPQGYHEKEYDRSINRLRTIRVSNNGVIEPFPSMVRIALNDILLPVDLSEPEFPPSFSIYTYRDCLSLRFVYPPAWFTRQEVSFLSKGIKEVLMKLVDQH